MGRKRAWRTVPEDNDHLVAGLENLLVAAEIAVTSRSAEEELKSHPHYPSLAAVTDSLKKWGIDSDAFEVDKKFLERMPLPCLTLLESRNGIFVTVTGVRDGMVEYVDPTRGPEKRPLAEFSAAWQGRVVVIEPSQDAGQADYQAQRTVEVADQRLRLVFRGLVLLAALAGGATLAWRSEAALWVLGLLALKLAGCVVCALLVSHYLGLGQALLNRFCSRGKAGGCESVLQSAGARLFGRLPLADVGLVYFATGAVVLFLAGLTGVGDPVGSQSLLIAALGVPMVVYSLYYQAVVLKKWCSLCLVVQGLILAEAVALFLRSPRPQDLLHWQGWALFLASLVLVSGSWGLIRPLLGKTTELHEATLRLRRLVRHPRVVEALLSGGEAVPMARLPGDVLLGNADAEHELLVVTHPSCKYCESAHHQAKALYEQCPDRVCVRFRILGWKGPVEAMRVAIHSTALSLEGRAEDACEVLHWWFTRADAGGDKVAELPLEDPNLSVAAQKALDTATRWALSTGVHGTPAIFIDHVRISSDLSLSDLSVFLAERMRLSQLQPA